LAPYFFIEKERFLDISIECHWLVCIPGHFLMLGVKAEKFGAVLWSRTNPEQEK